MNRAINRKFCVEAIEYFEDDFYFLVGQIENGIRECVDRKENSLMVKDYLDEIKIPPHRTLYSNNKLWNKIFNEFKLREFDVFVVKKYHIIISWEEDYSKHLPDLLKYKI